MASFTIQQAFELAVQHHQAGRLRDAEQIYWQILAQQPQHVHALNNLGLIANQVGRNDVAIDLIRRAIALDPNSPEAHNNLGNALRDDGQPDEAIAACQKAIILRPGYAEAHNNFGNALKDKKQFDEAIAAYRQALVLNPDYAEAHSNLGIVLREIGKLDEAIAAYRKAITIRPGYAQARSNLGVALKEKGQTDDAIACYRQSITLRPGDAETHNNLGVALKEIGRLDDAIAAYRQAIALKPAYAEAHSNLGNALKAKGLLDEALIHFRQAVTLNPNYAQGYYNLGVGLKESGQINEAIAAYQQAIVIWPGYAESHYNLGIALYAAGQLDASIDAFTRATVVNPGYAKAFTNLAAALIDKGKLSQAITVIQQAISLEPENAEAVNNLGVALAGKGQLDEAIAAYRRAITLEPNYASATNNLGNTLKDKGQLDEAIAAYRQAINLNPYFSEAHSNLLLMLNYHPRYDASEVAEEHRRWNRQHAEPLRQFIQPHLNDRDPNRRLRIGYVSPDFCEHPGGHNVLALLSAHDPAQVEIFCYAHVANPDAMTQRIRGLAHQWRSVSHLNDHQLAEQIRKDQIDILVDLAGHTAGHRLLVFASKPAPVQVTWLGYPNTTGLAAMDYRVTDAIADPPGMNDAFCSEQLIRLPDTAWCFQTSEGNFGPDERVLKAAAPVNFGCFNNFSKVTTPMLQMWAEILRSVPASTLLIKAKSLRCESVGRHVRAVMEAAGVKSDRLKLQGWHTSQEEHLASYRQVDISLDTFPYHGTTTTREALWMGVPVVTLAGQAHVSRVGVSLLTNVGLPELVASSPEEYVQIAIELAQNIPRLSELHATLRRRLENSPLMDGSRFARNFEAAYRRMWHKWCAISDGNS